MGSGTVKKIINRTASHGLFDTLKWLKSKMDTASREKRRGIDTAKFIEGETPIVDDCGRYEPVEYETIDCVFQTVPIQANDVLLDYGCGLGRVLMEGATHPFHKVIGIEYDQELADRCNENIRNFKASSEKSSIGNTELEVVVGDAQEFEIPESVSHIFLWNSFVGAVLENVAQKIKEHIDRSNHTVHFVLSLPESETESLKAFPFLQEPKRIETRFRTGADLYWFST